MMGLIVLVGIFQSWNVALSIFNLCLISAVMTMGANVQWGYAGLINFGLMGYAALGGLAAVLISVDPVQEAWRAGGFDILMCLWLIIVMILAIRFILKNFAKSNFRTYGIAAIIIAGIIIIRVTAEPGIEAIEAVNPAKTGFLGGFGLPIMFSWIIGALFAGGLAFLGLVNVLWGGLCALAQTDLKKLVAYSSINHMGYSLLGMAAVVAAGEMNGGDVKAAQAGLSGAVFQMFNHGTISAMLFILVGVVYERAHHRDIDGFGGLASQMPIYTGITALAFFAGLGLPGFSGFVSEAMCFIGAFPVFRTIVILSTIGILLNAAYFLWAFQRVFFGELNEKYKDMEEINSLELFTVIPLAVITLFFGIYPGPYLDLIKATMDQIIEKIAFVATYAVL